MGDEGFALPGSSYEELAKIIKGYGSLDRESPPADVAHMVGLHPTQVSRNNAFLVAVGLVEGGKKKKATPAGRAMARAFEHEMPEEIQQQWRKAVEGNEFLQKILSAVRVRKGMDISTLRSHVAYSAGQSRTTSAMAGAGAVVDILKAAGSLTEEDGKLVAAATQNPLRLGDSGGHNVADAQFPPEPSIPGAEARSPSVAAIPPIVQPISQQLGPVTLTIQVQIQCRPSEMAEVTANIKSLVSSLQKGIEASQEDDSSTRSVGTTAQEGSMQAGGRAAE